MIQLLETHTLTFKTKNNDGAFTESGDYVEGTEGVDVIANGNLQPFQNKKEQIVLPEGVTSEDSKVFYTQVEVKTSDHLNGDVAYTVDIDGFVFEAFKSIPWIGYGLTPDHYKIILIRIDQNELP